MRVRVLVLVLLVACHQRQAPAYVRYVELPESPLDVRGKVAGRAHIAGMTERAEAETDDVDRYVAALDRQEVGRSVMAERGADGPTLEPGEARYLLTASVLPHRGGTALELSGPTADSLDILQRGGRTYESSDLELTDEPVALDMSSEVGFAQAPHTDAAYRLDATMRLAVRVLSRGGDAPRIEMRNRLLVFLGIGGGYDGAGFVRPEIGVAFDNQEVVTPLRQPIAQSLRRSISLSFAVPKGEGFVAYEGSLALHLPPLGGIFGRIGYEVGDQRSGMTYMVGARFDKTPTLGIAGLVALGFLVYLAATEIDFCSEKNGPCE